MGSGTLSTDLDAVAAAVVVVLCFDVVEVSDEVCSDTSLSFLAGFGGSTGTHSHSLAR